MGFDRNRFFLGVSYILRPGSIVEPGNWGRFLGLYGDGFGDPMVACREAVYEEVRKEEFDHLPSRYSALFVSETLDALQEFLHSRGRNVEVAYEVELIEPAKPRHRTCINKVADHRIANTGVWKEAARSYWRGDDIELPEVLTMSAARIVSRCLSIPSR